MKTLRIRGREAHWVVQGGMGIGVSAHRLAGSVAREGCVGTLSSVDLRRHHHDLMQATGRSRDQQAIERANLVALDREIRAARELAGGNGLIAVNIMRAVSQYAAYARQACVSGADALVVGAGLALDLPELAEDWPEVALIPIVSEARAASLIARRWLRRGRAPDAIVIEHPGLAGGHLGAARLDEVADPRFEFTRVLPAIRRGLHDLGLDADGIALIAAGGINSPARVAQAFAAGADAVQVGTPFAVTVEGDAHPNFKRVLAAARSDDIVVFMSVAGLPARAVRTPWLAHYLEKEALLQSRARARRQCSLGWDCLAQCGLRDGLPRAGQFCIDHHLAAALRGDVERGLFFRGSEPLPFGSEIRPVRDLVAHLRELR
ncbi:MAG: 2-nitropropane dioxygenase [Betaproteobacteria bacterium RIFCSPLOWO2_02_67_12]|nr:MAG: 2-nitropropane dioxygenase [Betaproteobacteria bacterium RIFCSPLOWO2_02_67_12]OGA31017.1 MAG: 2-nitropropane dioxygenase [Betaproteobacteria bacterium RIFCSPLOWO2_02_FULL_68_150]OGA72749.1 MAG: 2-nitropropane dioxygenase [Betaproteobacteria bacterium RIFCSPLOWO2_12_FULL_67_28]